jgi:predicted transcriptional regulator
MLDSYTPIEQCPGSEVTSNNLDEIMSPFKLTRHMWRTAKKYMSFTSNSEMNEKICFKSDKQMNDDTNSLKDFVTEPKGEPILNKYYFIQGLSNAPTSVLYKGVRGDTGYIYSKSTKKGNSEKSLQDLDNNTYAVGRYVKEEDKYYIFECYLGEHKTRTDYSLKEKGKVILHKFKSVVFLDKPQKDELQKEEKKPFLELPIDIMEDKTTDQDTTDYTKTGGTRYKRKSTKKRFFRIKTKKTKT